MKTSVKYFFTTLCISAFLFSANLFVQAKEISENDETKIKYEELLSQRKFAEALKLIQPLAESGYTDAEYYMGLMYRKGYGLKRDLMKAFEWYLKAAQKEDGRALNSIAIMYEDGDGVEKDTDKALEFYREAADRGNTDAMANLGDIYYAGKLVKQNYKMALEFYTKSAEKGAPYSQFKLGMMYLNGVYVQLNGNEAMKWIKGSAENGYAPAQTEMGYQHRIGKFVQRDDYEGLRWYKLAADQGDVNAIYNIGNIYEAGEGASKNPAIAAEWYLKAAKGGNDSAQLKAGLYYELGTGFAKNMTEAIKWYKAAAEQGNTTAFYNLGLVYEFGKSVPVDLTEALRYYSLSSEKGNIDAKVKLAKMYRDGKGGEKDPAGAFKLMMEAALAGDAEAQNEVGVMTELGIGTAKDELGARQWYVKSADQGNMFAMFNVGLGLEYGKGGKGKSMANAIRWYERAAEKGHEKARQKLTEIYKKDLKSDTFQDLQITISCPPEKHCRVEVTNSSKNLRYSNIQLEITYDDPSFYGQQQRHEMTLEKGVGPNASETWTIGLLFGESPKSLKIKILKADAGAKQAPLVPASKLATPVLSYELTESRAPVFESTTSEPVLLRYKLRRDQIMKFVVDTNSDIEMRMGAQKLNMGQNMRIEAKARVTEVDDKGNISALVKITRLKMKINGMTEVEFDSDKPDDADPDFKAVTAMIGVGIPCKISPVGEMLETDLEPLRLAVRRVNNAALTKALEDSTSKMFEGTFVQLSRDAIAAGQTYKAGTIVSDKMKMHMSYKIDSVNSDKSMVVMSPVGILDCAADAIQDAEAKIISQEVSGWLLFDVEKGYISNGQVRSHVVFEFTANGQKIRMDMLTKALSTSNLN